MDLVEFLLDIIFQYFYYILSHCLTILVTYPLHTIRFQRDSYSILNLILYRGRKDGGWYLICESNVTGDEVEAYSIELANELIEDTQQIAGVEVLKEAED